MVTPNFRLLMVFRCRRGANATDGCIQNVTVEQVQTALADGKKLRLVAGATAVSTVEF